MNEYSNDPTPDPRLREALEALEALEAPPPADVRWERLHGAIADRAALPLARRRRQQRQRPRWLRPALPAAAAAVLALVVATQVFGPDTAPGGMAGNEVPAEFHPVVEQVLGTELSEFELDLLFGQVDAEMLVVAAVGN